MSFDLNARHGMKLLPLFALVLHFSLFPVAGQDRPVSGTEVLPSVEALFKRHFSAVGASPASAPVRALMMTGQVKQTSAQDPPQTFPFKSWVAALPRRSVFSMGDVYSSGWDGKTLWEDQGKKPEVLEGKAAHLEMVSPWNLIFPDSGHWGVLGETRCVGTREVEGTACHVVECVREKFPPIRLYFSSETGHLMRKDWSCPHHADGDKDGHRFFLIFTDYKEVNGTQYPHTLVMGDLKADDSAGSADTEFSVESIEVNSEVPENTFALPAGLQLPKAP